MPSGPGFPHSASEILAVLDRCDRGDYKTAKAYDDHVAANPNNESRFFHPIAEGLAGAHREAVLATAAERRASVPPDVPELLVIDEWNHPDVVEDSERPSGSQTFQQLAGALVSGRMADFKPSLATNTHWRHWPEGGSL